MDAWLVHCLSNWVTQTMQPCHGDGLYQCPAIHFNIGQGLACSQRVPNSSPRQQKFHAKSTRTTLDLPFNCHHTTITIYLIFYTILAHMDTLVRMLQPSMTGYAPCKPPRRHQVGLLLQQYSGKWATPGWDHHSQNDNSSEWWILQRSIKNCHLGPKHPI